MQKLGSKGLALIKSFEKFEPKPYNDGYGFMTIGYGHRIMSGEKLTHLTEAEALTLLARDVEIAERGVRQCVKVPLTQCQFDALVSLQFNWGKLAQSELLKRLNRGNYEGAAERLGEWPITSGGKPSRGLERRRAAEKALFLTKDNAKQS